METPKKSIDPTMNHRIHTRNTFNHVFPIYAPKLSNFMSSTQSNFTSSLDFSEKSEFVMHNKDTLKKTFNKKADRIITYTEEMLKIKNLSKLNRK